MKEKLEGSASAVLAIQKWVADVSTPLLVTGTCGKSWTIRQACTDNQTGVSLAYLSLVDILSTFSTDTTTMHGPKLLAKISSLFMEKSSNHVNLTKILVLKDIDQWTSSKTSFSVALLHSLQFLLRLKELHQVQLIVIATCTSSSAIHPYIHPFFMQTIRIPSLSEIHSNEASHWNVIQKLFQEYAHNLSKDQLQPMSQDLLVHIADSTPGYTYRDYISLFERALDYCHTNQTSTCIDPLGIDYALSSIRSPSSASSAIGRRTVTNRVRWSDIGGLEKVKMQLIRRLEWMKLGSLVPQSRGILLYGPSGTGKTLLAKAVAYESGFNFLPVAVSTLVRGIVGDSEKGISELFSKAKTQSPCVLFLDEIESLFPPQHQDKIHNTGAGTVAYRCLAQFIQELDEIRTTDSSDFGRSEVLVLGATNFPERLPHRLLRPGRLDILLHVPLPTLEEREKILKLYLSKSVNVNVSMDMRIKIAAKTEGWSSASLKELVRRARVKAHITKVDLNTEHLLSALAEQE